MGGQNNKRLVRRTGASRMLGSLYETISRQGLVPKGIFEATVEYAVPATFSSAQGMFHCEPGRDVGFKGFSASPLHSELVEEGRDACAGDEDVEQDRTLCTIDRVGAWLIVSQCSKDCTGMTTVCGDLIRCRSGSRVEAMNIAAAKESFKALKVKEQWLSAAPIAMMMRSEVRP